MNKRVRAVLLLGEDNLSKIVYHYIKDICKIEATIIEEPVPKRVVLLKRLKRKGIFRVIGEILFIVFNTAFLKRLSKERINEIVMYNNLNKEDIKNYIKVDSVNSDKVIDILQDISPDIVIVNGTRIISPKVLHSIDIPFVNIHVGITPKYRGVHGGYWALSQNDKKNCGVTIHLVDTGIDTGDILYQDTITLLPKDNFNTYPYLQIAKALPLLKAVIEDIEKNSLKTVKNSLPSRIWTHPTLFEYVKYYIIYGVK